MFGKNHRKKKNKTSASIGYLGKAKVRSLLFVSMIDAVDGIIMTATDKVILGNMIGPEAVSATMLMAPLFLFTGVFEALIANGSSVLYTRAVGNYDTEKSHRILGLASFLAIVTGVLLGAAAFLVGDNLFSLMGAEGKVLRYGTEYFFFLRFIFLLSPLHSVLNEIMYVDGDEIRVGISSFALLLGNAGFSILLIPHLGIMGASLGSAIGFAMSLVISVSHFFSKKYRVVPILSFDPKVLKEMFVIGTVDAVNNAADCLYVFLMEIFVIEVLGSEYLVVLVIMGLVYEMMAIGGGVSDSMKTMLVSYWGDKNKEAMKSLLLFGIRLTIYIGVIYIAIVWILSPFFPRMYGINTPEISSFAITACRIASLSSIAYIFYGLLLEYYGNIGRYRLQLTGNLLDSLLVRLPLVLILGFPFGPVGMWVGEALTPYVCLILLSFIVIRMYGIGMFPFLFNEGTGSSLNMSYRTEINEIVDIRDDLEAFLVEKDVPKIAVNFCMMLLEDMSMLIKDANPEEHIHIDLFVSCDRESTRLVLWNDGKPIDMTDPDLLPSGIRSYIVSSILKGFKKRQYQKTAGYNRTSFVIPYKKLIKDQKKKAG